MTPNGGDAVVSALRNGGVTTVFGIPASYTVEIYDALARNGGVRSITARNEQAAAFMADGYARRSGGPGVAIVTGGPGLGNTITGLQTAYADSSPLVVIASDHDPDQRAAHPAGLPHEAYDQEGLARAAGALVRRADDPGSIREAVEETLARCRKKRPRPGVVLISRRALEAPATPPSGQGRPGRAHPPADRPWNPEGAAGPPDTVPVSHPWIDPIEAALPDRPVTVCVDVTMALRWIPGVMPPGPKRRLMAPWSFQTLGWAYAAALGAQAAAPGDAVLAVMGDGGALFTLGEMAAAAQHRLPVCLLVFNNRCYGIIAEVQDELCGGRRFGVDLEQPDFTAVAEAFGMPAFRVHTPDQLEAALRRSIGNGEPGLVEALVGVEDLGSGSAHP